MSKELANALDALQKLEQIEDAQRNSPANKRIEEMKAAVALLPESEQAEVANVRERLQYLTARYGSSAELAIVWQSLEIAAGRGQ